MGQFRCSIPLANPVFLAPFWLSKQNASGQSRDFKYLVFMKFSIDPLWAFWLNMKVIPTVCFAHCQPHVANTAFLAEKMLKKMEELR